MGDGSRPRESIPNPLTLNLNLNPKTQVYNLTLEQLVGDGSEDYWSGGLYVIMVTAGNYNF